MPEPVEDVSEEPEKSVEPSPDFEEKVEAVLRKVLPEFLHKEEPAVAEPSAPKAQRRTLREEESEMEALVTKVVGKLKDTEPPPVAKAEPEEPPGPPPRKKRISVALWGE